VKKPEIKSDDVYAILFGGCMVPEELTLKLKSRDGKKEITFLIKSTNRGDFIIYGSELMKIDPGNYLVEIYIDRSDESRYGGGLIMQ